MLPLLHVRTHRAHNPQGHLPDIRECENVIRGKTKHRTHPSRNALSHAVVWLFGAWRRNTGIKLLALGGT